MSLLKEVFEDVKLLRKENNKLHIAKDRLSILIQPDPKDNSSTLLTGMLEGDSPIKKGDIIERQLTGEKLEVIKTFTREYPKIFGFEEGLGTRLTLKEYDHDSSQQTINDNAANNDSNKLFIGHGHSLVWRELKDFIVDTLGLEYEEFNRISAAGKSTSDRLNEMLESCCVAFLIMTGEDEQADGSLRARDNVIHEVGLFQGKLGFEKAIVLLEEGCEDFSNIHGITYIPFPKGNIKASFEDIRRVLERESILE